jgi:hypothetical protein
MIMAQEVSAVSGMRNVNEHKRKSLVPVVVVGCLQLAGCASGEPQGLSLFNLPAATNSASASPAKELPRTTQTVHKSATPAADRACAEGPGCVDRLKRLVAQTDRSWITRPEAPASFADGTRLFAYRALRGQLTCRQLVLAIADVRTSSASLLRSASTVPPARVHKASALAKDVGGELGAEREARCGVAAARNDPVRSQ